MVQILSSTSPFACGKKWPSRKNHMKEHQCARVKGHRGDHKCGINSGDCGVRAKNYVIKF